jgi:uncharacterized membrane protein YdjX (TVP38/TMEM64 family)
VITSNRATRLLVFSLIVLGAVAVYLFREQLDVAALQLWVDNNPMTAPLLFIILYVALTTLLFSSAVLSLTGGILFGPLWGSLINQLAATLSAAATFMIARYLSADWLERRLGGELRELKHGVERRGWRFVLVLRIVPGLPFSLLNYALGLTRIRLLHFVSVTSLCILPRVIFFSYAGYTGRRAAVGKEIDLETVLILAVLATIVTLPYLFKRLRRGHQP